MNSKTHNLITVFKRMYREAIARRDRIPASDYASEYVRGMDKGANLQDEHGLNILELVENSLNEESLIVLSDYRARQAVKKFQESAIARMAGKHSEANCLAAEAGRYWRLFEEEYAVLTKPQPPSKGNYNGIEI